MLELPSMPSMQPCPPDGCWCLGMTTSQGSGYGRKILQVYHTTKTKRCMSLESVMHFVIVG